MKRVIDTIMYRLIDSIGTFSDKNAHGRLALSTTERHKLAAPTSQTDRQTGNIRPILCRV